MKRFEPEHYEEEEKEDEEEEEEEEAAVAVAELFGGWACSLLLLI